MPAAQQPSRPSVAHSLTSPYEHGWQQHVAQLKVNEKHVLNQRHCDFFFYPFDTQLVRILFAYTDFRVAACGTPVNGTETSFLDAATVEPLKLEKVALSFFDYDGSRPFNDAGHVRECMQLKAPSTSLKRSSSPPSEIVVNDLPPPDTTFSSDPLYCSTTWGTGSDNPTDRFSLNALQRALPPPERVGCIVLLAVELLGPRAPRPDTTPGNVSLARLLLAR